MNDMIKGFVELIRPFQVRGWAYDTEMPDTAVAVSLSVSGEEVITASADLFRNDLLQSGLGSGKHGFVLNVDRRLPLTNPREIQVECRSPFGPRVTLQPVSQVIIDEPVPAPETTHQASPIIGYYQTLPSGEVAGWAYYPLRPSEHLSIEVLSDDGIIATGLADQFRADLISALIGNGDHGFTVPTAAPSDAIQVIARSADGATARLQPQTTAVIAQEKKPKWIEPQLLFPGCSQDCAQHPVFVLGAARSGTSAMAQALMAATRYVGHEEGHLLDLISPLIHVVERHYEDRADEWRDRANTMVGAVSKKFIEAGAQHIFVELARTLFPKGWWIDKTPSPSMIAAAPLLRQIWPEARFIFMKRRGIENILSRMRKFPNVPFADHCRDWTLAMQAWLAVRESLTGAAIEIDQIYLATRPQEAAAMLGPFLMLQPSEVVTLGETLATDRPERTAEQFGSIVSINALGWTENERRMFEEICGPTMKSYDYNR